MVSNPGRTKITPILLEITIYSTQCNRNDQFTLEMFKINSLAMTLPYVSFKIPKKFLFVGAMFYIKGKVSSQNKHESSFRILKIHARFKCLN